jgi:hypothetical protein
VIGDVRARDEGLQCQLGLLEVEQLALVVCVGDVVSGPSRDSKTAALSSIWRTCEPFASAVMVCSTDGIGGRRPDRRSHPALAIREKHRRSHGSGSRATRSGTFREMMTRR